MISLKRLVIVILAIGVYGYVDVRAQLDRSDTPVRRSPEVGVGSGAFGMGGSHAFGGPMIEGRWLQPVTHRTSLRVRVGYTAITYGQSDSTHEVGNHLLHGALEGYWGLTPPEAQTFLYGTFGVTASRYRYTDFRSGFYLTPRPENSDTYSDGKFAFGPSGGLGLRTPLSDVLSMSAEVQGVWNLVYPYEPSFGGSAMVGLGWKL